MQKLFWSVAALFWTGVAQGSSVCINEVLYDPAGSDAGYEFVELYNCTDQAQSMEGWSLEAGNGAAPGDWRLQWRGSDRDLIAPHDHFLIAGEQVAVGAEVRAALVLQNGPDGLRLIGPAGIADRIGWGELAHAEFYEGRAAPDVDSGSSLARMPDGADTDQNDLDLRPRLHPTPGAPNAVAWQIAVTRLGSEPPIIDVGAPAQISAHLTNLGIEGLVLSDLQLFLELPTLAVGAPCGLNGKLAPEETREITWSLTGGGERGPLSGRLRCLAPQNPEQSYGFDLRIGRGAVLLSEIQYDPARGEGEWIELYNGSADTVDLSGWTLADHSGRKSAISGARVPLAPGAMLLVAEDAGALLAKWPALSPNQMAARSGAWPTLNNSLDREFGYADEVLLCDANGLPVDYVRYMPSDLDGGGISLERWIADGSLVEPRTLIPCSSRGGATPGRAGWLAEAGRSDQLWLMPQPNPFCPDRDPSERFCRIAVPVAVAGGHAVTADLFSMAGRRVATLAEGAEVHGAHLLLWDGRSSAGEPLPTGLYLLRIFLRTPEGQAARSYVKPLTLLRG